MFTFLSDLSSTNRSEFKRGRDKRKRKPRLKKGWGVFPAKVIPSDRKGNVLTIKGHMAKGAVIGGVTGGTLGAVTMAPVAGPVGALVGGTGGAIDGSLRGAGIGLGAYGIRRRIRMGKSPK